MTRLNTQNFRAVGASNPMTVPWEDCLFTYIWFELMVNVGNILYMDPLGMFFYV